MSCKEPIKLPWPRNKEMFKSKENDTKIVFVFFSFFCSFFKASFQCSPPLLWAIFLNYLKQERFVLASNIFHQKGNIFKKGSHKYSPRHKIGTFEKWKTDWVFTNEFALYVRILLKVSCSRDHSCIATPVIQWSAQQHLSNRINAGFLALETHIWDYSWEKLHLLCFQRVKECD